ncbi:MAG: hypothetical protein MI863_03340, partial [Desulfobacterales bacterium]|nr:hypothetical protein [Desulfobacterales bacterium]
MSENETNLSLGLALFLFVLLIFLLTRGKKERQDLDGQVYLYSGAKFIISKFVSTKEAPLPTGVVWLIGLYFAAYAFTSQRYESRLDKIEFRYSTFTTQIAANATFSNDRLMGILNEKIPVKPSIYNPFSIFKSFLYGPYFHS